MKQTLAIYGGSFDPPHIAHAWVALYVLATENVDRVLVVPAAEHPFNKPLCAFSHRVRMCELAMRHLQRVEVSTIEDELPKPSLTLRTLERLRSDHDDATLRLVIGSDLLSEASGWHEFERVRKLAPLIVVPRAGGAPSERSSLALPNVSSTEVRRRLREGLETKGLLDHEVAKYAKQHRLYVS
jgi:nicotinate-nucleotide adenylyltransferase